MLRTEKKLLFYYRIILVTLLVFTVFTLLSVSYFGASSTRVESLRTSSAAIETAFSEHMQSLILIRRALRGEDVSFAQAEECPVNLPLIEIERTITNDSQIMQLIAELKYFHKSLHEKLAAFEPHAVGAEDHYYTEILPDYVHMNTELRKIAQVLNDRLNAEIVVSRLLMVILTILCVSGVAVGIFMLNRYSRTLNSSLTKPLAEILHLLANLPEEALLPEHSNDLGGLRTIITKAVKMFKREHLGYKILKGWATDNASRDRCRIRLCQDLLATLFGDGTISAGIYYDFQPSEHGLIAIAKVGFPDLLEAIDRNGDLLDQTVQSRKSQEKVIDSNLAMAIPIGIDQLFGVLVCLIPAQEDIPLERQFLLEVGLQFDLVLQDNQNKQEIISLLTKSEEELAHLEAVFYSSLDGICTISRDKVITAWNRGAEEITGYTSDEAVGSRCCDILGHTSEHGESICGTDDCALCQALNGKEVKAMEAYLQARGNQSVPIKISAAPVKAGDGTINEVVQIFHDMTEQKLSMARLEEANRAKSEFLATMSHELRTPLNAIIGFSDLMGQDESLNSKQRRFSANILRAAKHLLSLINDVLDLSKVEAGRLSWEANSVELIPLIHNAALLLKEKAINEGIELELDISPALPISVYSDERKIKQIIYNLLANAIKFTPSGKKVGLKADVADQVLRITVWDEGIGIPADKLGVIFNPFIQVDSSLTRRHQGTGLGLSIVKRFIELADGELSVESEPGVGSKFTVKLPLRNTNNLISLGEQVSASQEVTVNDQIGTSLIIEDNPDAATVIQNYLGQLGYQGIVKATAKEVFTYLEQAGPPDFVTLDILLPDMSGWEILSWLRQNPKYKAIPVIIVSVLPEQSKGFALGADGYLTKPVDRQELYNTITRILTKSGTQASNDTKGRVLVVDDEPMTVEVIVEHLKQRGFSVNWAYSAATGLKRAEEWRPDLIILDLIMPEVNGFQFLQHKAANTRISTVPTVILTSKHLTLQEKQHLAQFSKGVYNKADLFTQDFLSQLGAILQHGKGLNT